MKSANKFKKRMIQLALDIKQEAKDKKDAKENTCLDKVYITRVDYMTVRLETAI